MSETEEKVNMTVTEAPEVRDLRADNDPSLQAVPRITSYEQLREWMGVEVRRDFGWNVAPTGALVYKLVRIELRTGAATYIPKVLKANGTPYEGVRVARTWNGAPTAANGEQLVPDYPGLLGYGTNKGVAGWTNASGDSGFPYSGGSGYPAKGAKGPDAIFPLIPAPPNQPQYADCLDGLGWYLGTDHLTPNGVWQLVTKTGTPVPPPTGSKFSLALYQDGVDLGVRIAFVEQPAGSGWALVLLDETGQTLGSSRFV